MPKKPTKWGMKAFVLSDALTGYMYNWHLYTGMSVWARVSVCAYASVCVCTQIIMLCVVCKLVPVFVRVKEKQVDLDTLLTIFV